MDRYDEYDRQTITNLLHTFTASELTIAARRFGVADPAMSKWLAASRLCRAGKAVSDVRQVLTAGRTR